MPPDDQQDGTTYVVVVNHEEQYSIWAKDMPIPPGWRPVGIEGEKSVCLSYIEQVWTDMRPLSLRKKMQQAQSRNGTS